MELSKGTIIGLVIFIAGIVLMSGYSLYLGVQEITDNVVLLSGLIIVIGAIILIVSIIIDQQKNKKEWSEKISKEDLRP